MVDSAEESQGGASKGGWLVGKCNNIFEILLLLQLDYNYLNILHFRCLGLFTDAITHDAHNKPSNPMIECNRPLYDLHIGAWDFRWV